MTTDLPDPVRRAVEEAPDGREELFGDECPGERGDSRKPRFGEWMRGVWAGRINPQRDGMYVRTVRRTGKFNFGVWHELTDGNGRFWQYLAKDTVFMRDRLSREEEVEQLKARVAELEASAGRAYSAACVFLAWEHQMLGRDLGAVVPEGGLLRAVHQLAQEAEEARSREETLRARVAELELMLRKATDYTGASTLRRLGDRIVIVQDIGAPIYLDIGPNGLPLLNDEARAALRKEL